MPARVSSCLGRQRAMRLLDHRDHRGRDVGRVSNQEEYIEWRSVHNRGRWVGIEMTTELPEYWEVLAAHAPRQTLRLMGRLTGTPTPPPRAAYGRLDPFRRGVSTTDRCDAFVDTMLGDEAARRRRLLTLPKSSYNDGRSGLCCLAHQDNTLHALVNLVCSAAAPVVISDAITRRPRFASGREAIDVLGAIAIDGRSSDPVVVESVARWATEGRSVSFDRPVGVYFGAIQRHEIVRPDGSPIPATWMRLSRGHSGSHFPDGRDRYQRLTLTVPPASGLTVDDLRVRRTDEPIRWGGQLAELITLKVIVGVTKAINPGERRAAKATPARIPCRDIRRDARMMGVSG